MRMQRNYQESPGKTKSVQHKSPCKRLCYSLLKPLKALQYEQTALISLFVSCLQHASQAQPQQQDYVRIGVPVDKFMNVFIYFVLNICIR